MESLRFVHAADLHLDSPFRGVGDASTALKDRLQAATLGALGRIVDHTIHSKADFLVIAGDIYDSKDRSLRALVSFRKEMERLAEQNIPVYIVHDQCSCRRTEGFGTPQSDYPNFDGSDR